MLNKLFDYFERKITSSASDDKIGQSEKEQTLILAATALMIEVARSDENKAPVELEVISQILVSSLGVDPKESQLILDAAQEQSEEAHDLFQFTGLINQNFSREEKEDLIIAAISILIKTLIIIGLFGTIVFRLKLSKEINALIGAALKKLGFSSP